MQRIEAIQSYWDFRPCNIRHSAAPVGSERWSREVTERKYFVEPHIPQFAQFGRWKGKRVLEIGCGIGTDTAGFVKAGADVDAVDISHESIRLAVMRCDAHFWYFNAEDHLPTGTYDLIYSFGVLHHTPHPERILEAARQRLANGGELRVMVYSRWCFKRIFGGQPEAQANCPLARSYTVKQARELIESRGLRVQSIVKAHIFPWRIKDYIQHRYVKRWQYRWMPKAIFSWLERHFGEHLLIVARKA